jgi:hypothetical protein
MNVDIEAERLSVRPVAYISLREAARRYFISPRTGRPSHVSAVLRAVVNGHPSRQHPGQRIHLAGWRQPGGWVTTEQAVREFFEDLTRDRLGAGSISAPSPTPAARRRAIEKAEKALSAMGI